jgi:hypothetical protein
MVTFRRLGIATALALTVTAAAPASPVGAATTSVAGMFVFDADSTCGEPPAGHEEFDELTFVISGDLDGCWYTNIGRGWDLGPPSGLYFEVGRELFVGRVRGGPVGTFSTTYTFESRWDPAYTAGGTEIWGRCQHVIVRGSGTGGLHAVTGFIGRTDVVTDVINDGTVGRYRGVVRQP